ncbi:MAG TPA: YbxH family protein [Bacillus bacterium]|nr:YbxH family protein [Bacillus sp. (in: firmicutes)]
MGAIEREGYVFHIEFSQITKTAAIHVTKEGDFVTELTFPFEGNEPTQEHIDNKIEDYLNLNMKEW